MDKEKKPLLNSKEQVAHLQKKGIHFCLVTENDAEEYLRNNNNYFKLRAYRKNFDTYQEGDKKGQYIGLDFEMLKDLAIIDMRLRYVVIQMALDVEHFIKVKLLHIVEQRGEDGYQIVTDYFSHLQSCDEENSTNRFGTLQNELSRNAGNPYCGGIIEKCQDGYAVWAFVEVVPLGSLIHFYRFCADRFGNKDMKTDYYLLMAIKELRNAAAHNNCILYNMKVSDAKKRPDYHMIKKISSIPKSTRDKHLSNERMRQLCTLLYAHSKIVTSSGVHDHTKRMLNDLLQRMYRHIDYYKGNTIITSNFDFFKKTVDIFFKTE